MEAVLQLFDFHKRLHQGLFRHFTPIYFLKKLCIDLGTIFVRSCTVNSNLSFIFLNTSPHCFYTVNFTNEEGCIVFYFYHFSQEHSGAAHWSECRHLPYI